MSNPTTRQNSTYTLELPQALRGWLESLRNFSSKDSDASLIEEALAQYDFKNFVPARAYSHLVTVEIPSPIYDHLQVLAEQNELSIRELIIAALDALPQTPPKQKAMLKKKSAVKSKKVVKKKAGAKKKATARKVTKKKAAKKVAHKTARKKVAKKVAKKSASRRTTAALAATKKKVTKKKAATKKSSKKK